MLGTHLLCFKYNLGEFPVSYPNRLTSLLNNSVQQITQLSFKMENFSKISAKSLP